MTKEESAQPPAIGKRIIDAESISRSISRLAYEILEKNFEVNLLSSNQSQPSLAIVGIKTGGEYIARRIWERICEIDPENYGKKPPSFGVLDIMLYRDDIFEVETFPTLKGTDLPFSVSHSRIILVDDVLYTGRTIRAALDAIIDFGRPKRVELAVLIDRGHRELPIRPDYVGKNLPTTHAESIKVRLKENGYEDGVYLTQRKK
jgi:pyrimidine operon attenuation protein/uracil phosphoribosyltransferase